MGAGECCPQVSKLLFPSVFVFSSPFIAFIVGVAAKQFRAVLYHRPIFVMVKRMLGALSQSIAHAFYVVAIHSRSHGDSLRHEAVDVAKSCVCDTHELLAVI
jgi:hypothetical protein